MEGIKKIEAKKKKPGDTRRAIMQQSMRFSALQNSGGMKIRRRGRKEEERMIHNGLILQIFNLWLPGGGQWTEQDTHGSEIQYFGL